MMQKQFIDQKHLQRWFKPEIYEIYINLYNDLLIEDEKRFEKKFKDDKGFFEFFVKKLLSTNPNYPLKVYFNENINVNDVLFALNLYHENNKIFDFYIKESNVIYKNFHQFATELEYILLSNDQFLQSNNHSQKFNELNQDLVDYVKFFIHNPTRKQIDDFYKNPTNQKNFILKHFSMKTLNNRTIKYKNIKIDNDLIREFMKVRYDYDTESIVRDQRSRSKDDEYSM